MAASGLPVIGHALKRGGGDKSAPPSSIRDLGKAVLKILAYMVVGILLYTFEGLNERDPDADPDWDWDVVDCIYFTMVTITTVGYGDMPLLSQRMRMITAFFGIFGVVAIAGSLNVIADWCAPPCVHRALPPAACFFFFTRQDQPRAGGAFSDHPSSAARSQVR